MHGQVAKSINTVFDLLLIVDKPFLHSVRTVILSLHSLADMSSQLPDWPPSFTQEQTSHLLLLATTYALGHGFTLLPPHTRQTGPIPTSSIPAPLSLCPSPFPKDLYELAVKIQPAYNALYVNVTRDWVFLDKVMGGVVSKVDEFQGELWRAWKSCREELVQVGDFVASTRDHSSKPS
jgi:hypothetical protein